MPNRAVQKAPSASAGGVQELHLTDAEFGRVCEMLKSRFGIAVDATKRALVEAKLAKLVRKGRYGSFAEYEKAELRQGNSAGLSDFIDQLTTNHTFWWRESAHFDYFTKTVLPELDQKLQSRKDLRVWNAVSSTGEEPYTVAMLMREHFGPRYSQWKAGLLASDISARALKKAVAGVYESGDIATLPPPLGTKYFDKQPDGTVKVNAAIRGDVSFRRLNLMSRPFPFRSKFHVVWCRNVMIYFDQKTNQELAQAIHDVLEPGGYLFVGHSEPLDRYSCPFEVVGPSIYRRRS